MMRKSIYFGLIPVALLFALASCKKTYTCNCTYKDGQGGHKVSYTLDPASRQDAVTDCDNKAFLLQDKSSVSCSIE